MSDVLVILGMHRSGTSLLARYLKESGVFMGHEFLGKHSTNPAGHFEDLGFLQFHNDLLSAHGMDHLVSDPVQWEIGPDMVSRAEALIDARQNYPVWGWKDPRTCLFLDFWTSLIPQLFGIISYRHYIPVIRSLLIRDLYQYRRRSNRLQRLSHPKFTKEYVAHTAKQYLQVWIHYYSLILEFATSLEHKSFVIPFEDITGSRFPQLEQLLTSTYHLNLPTAFDPKISQSEAQADVKFNLNTDTAAADAIDQKFRTLMMTKSS